MSVLGEYKNSWGVLRAGVARHLNLKGGYQPWGGERLQLSRCQGVDTKVLDKRQGTTPEKKRYGFQMANRQSPADVCEKRWKSPRIALCLRKNGK